MLFGWTLSWTSVCLSHLITEMIRRQHYGLIPKIKSRRLNHFYLKNWTFHQITQSNSTMEVRNWLYLLNNRDFRLQIGPWKDTIRLQISYARREQPGLFYFLLLLLIELILGRFVPSINVRFSCPKCLDEIALNPGTDIDTTILNRIDDLEKLLFELILLAPNNSREKIIKRNPVLRKLLEKSEL